MGDGGRHEDEEKEEEEEGEEEYGKEIRQEEKRKWIVLTLYNKTSPRFPRITALQQRRGDRRPEVLVCYGPRNVRLAGHDDGVADVVHAAHAADVGGHVAGYEERGHGDEVVALEARVEVDGQAHDGRQLEVGERAEEVVDERGFAVSYC